MSIYVLKLVTFNQWMGASWAYTWEKAYKTEKDALIEKSRLLAKYSKDLIEFNQLYDDEYSCEGTKKMEQIEEQWPFNMDEDLQRIDISKIELIEGE